MGPDGGNAQATEVLPLTVSVFLRFELLIGACAFVAGLYLLARFGLQRYYMVIDFAIMTVCYFSSQVFSDRFYEDIKEQYRDTYMWASLEIPPNAIFYRTMTSGVGRRRRKYGYLFVAARITLFFAGGLLFSGVAILAGWVPAWVPGLGALRAH